jgi:hypothetical protein
LVSAKVICHHPYLPLWSPLSQQNHFVRIVGHFGTFLAVFTVLIIWSFIAGSVRVIPFDLDYFQSYVTFTVWWSWVVEALGWLRLMKVHV